MDAVSGTLAPVAALEEIGQLVREARERKFPEKQDAAAKELGVATPHLSRIENGKSPPGLPLAKRIAAVLDIDMVRMRTLLAQHWIETRLPAELRDQAMKAGQVPAELVTAARGRMRPVIGRTSCGPWIEAIDKGTDAEGERYRFPVPKAHKLRDKEAFWVEAEGDSMTGSGIEEGALLLVERVQPTNGQHALVQLDGKAMVKVWRETRDRVVLTATNPNFSPQETTVWKSKDEERIGWAWSVTLVQPPARPL